MGGALVKKKSVPVLSRCAHSHCVADLSASVALPFRLAKVPGAGGPNDPSGIAVMGRSSRNKPSALLKPRPGGGECPACGVLTADRWHNLPGEFVDGARADMGDPTAPPSQINDDSRGREATPWVLTDVTIHLQASEEACTAPVAGRRVSALPRVDALSAAHPQ